MAIIDPFETSTQNKLNLQKNNNLTLFAWRQSVRRHGYIAWRKWGRVSWSCMAMKISTTLRHHATMAL
jgi:hypothetical protein